MSNRWSKGGRHQRGNKMSIDFSAFAYYGEQIDKLGGDLKAIFSDAMEQAAETVEYDVLEAVKEPNLPRQGLYSGGDTEASVIRNATVHWEGPFGEIGIGFDKTKPGAGGFLITGTPRMEPDWKLEDIFARKTYAKTIRKQIDDSLNEALKELGGKK